MPPARVARLRGALGVRRLIPVPSPLSASAQTESPFPSQVSVFTFSWFDCKTSLAWCMTKAEARIEMLVTGKVFCHKTRSTVFWEPSVWKSV